MNQYPDALPIGTILRSKSFEYRLQGVLGQGGFGITYVAIGHRLDPNIDFPPFKCAIKEHFFRESSRRHPSTLDVAYDSAAEKSILTSRTDFVDEARRINRICNDQPCIINVGEVFEAHNTAYYVMEYIEGMSLRKYVANHGGRLTDQEMIDVMVPVIWAMSYLHENRMTHLDIKPDNVIVSYDSEGALRPVLIDFGLAKQYGDDGNPLSRVNLLACSDGFSPVEQYNGILSFTPQADVYAIGATMLFCITGQNPPKADAINTPESLERLIPEGTDEAVSRIIKAAMRHFFYERPTTAKEILDAPSVEEVAEQLNKYSIITTNPAGNAGRQNVAGSNNETTDIRESFMHRNPAPPQQPAFTPSQQPAYTPPPQVPSGPSSYSSSSEQAAPVFHPGGQFQPVGGDDQGGNQRKGGGGTSVVKMLLWAFAVAVVVGTLMFAFLTPIFLDDNEPAPQRKHRQKQPQVEAVQPDPTPVESEPADSAPAPSGTPHPSSHRPR